VRKARTPLFFVHEQGFYVRGLTEAIPQQKIMNC
jgi:hypothetical protein